MTRSLLLLTLCCSLTVAAGGGCADDDETTADSGAPDQRVADLGAGKDAGDAAATDADAKVADRGTAEGTVTPDKGPGKEGGTPSPDGPAAPDMMQPDLVPACPAGWTAMTSATTAGLYDVWGSGPSEVYAVGGKELVRYDGKQWVAMPLPSGLTQSLSTLWGPGKGDLFVGGSYAASSTANGGVVHRYNGGKWTTQKFWTTANEGVASITGTGKTDVTAVGWEAAGSFASYWQVHRFDGTAWKSSNIKAQPQAGQLTRAWAVSSTDLWATGSDCTDASGVCKPLVQHYDGTTWTDMSGKLPKGVGGVTGVWAAGKVVAITGYDNTTGADQGTVAVYDGTKWTLSHTVSGKRLNDVWGTSASNIWVVGHGGVVYHYDGSSWKNESASTTSNIWAIWGSGIYDMFIVGDSGTIYHGCGL